MSGERVLVGRRYVDDEVRHIRELMDERAEALALALDTRSAIIEHRLEVLNDAHAETRRVAGTVVTRELYDAGRSEELARREELVARVQEARDQAARDLAALREEVMGDVNFRAGQAKAHATVMSVLVFAASVLVSWWLR